MGSLSLLQGIFPTQGSNPGLPHCGQILYQLSHKGSPRILEWVAYPSPENLPNPGTELRSPALQADSLPTELCHYLQKTWVAQSLRREAGCSRTRRRLEIGLKDGQEPRPDQDPPKDAANPESCSGCEGVPAGLASAERPCVPSTAHTGQPHAPKPGRRRPGTRGLFWGP